MCTVTWFRETGGYRLFFNRDELRRRAPAVPPRVHSAGARPYIAPLDGAFAGSWVSVNDAGLVLGLLNGYSAGDDRPPVAEEDWVSRGLLLTTLADFDSAAAVAADLGGRELRCYRSFWLLALDPEGGCFARWEGGRLRLDDAADAPIPLVSSSFDTATVRRSRERTFQAQRSSSDSEPLELHLAYHESHVPERGPSSPCMHRPDARTVSFTCVRVDSHDVRMSYAPHPPCQGRPRDEPVRLPRSPSKT